MAALEPHRSLRARLQAHATLCQLLVRHGGTPEALARALEEAAALMADARRALR